MGGFLVWICSKNEYSLSESGTIILIEECVIDFPLKTIAYFSHILESYQVLKRKCYRYWYEEDKFDSSALSDLCQYLAKLEAISLAQLKDLHFIQEQILKHLVWNFDSQDLYAISDLPSDYGKYLDSIECEINELFGRLEWIL